MTLADLITKESAMLRKHLIFTAVVFLYVILIPATVLAGQRFTDNGDGTVTDHQLGVMWSQTDNQGDITWTEAQQWVKYTFPYTLGRMYSNWRLPTLDELKSLVDQAEGKGYETACGQWVKVVPQIRLTCGWVWTSETNALAPTARIFNFNNVYHYTVRKSQKRAYRVLAVRDLP
jgi:hypothetical protein